MHLRIVSHPSLVVIALPAGKSILDAGAAQRIIAQLQGGVAGGGRGDDRVASLTGQERTAKNYVSSLLMKLGLQRRSQAAVLAVRHAGPDRA
jgi:two-component system, NarL family, response regulator DevR